MLCLYFPKLMQIAVVHNPETLNQKPSVAYRASKWNGSQTEAGDGRRELPKRRPQVQEPWQKPPELNA